MPGLLATWSAGPALLGAALLAAGLGGADHVDRAERAVAARLSWCGVDASTPTLESVRWQGQSTDGTRVIDLVVVPAGPATGAQRLVLGVAPDAGGGWRVWAGDGATRAALGDCLDMAEPAGSSVTG